MGCGSSTPVKDAVQGMVKAGTTAASHANLRMKDSSQHGPNLDVGPDYKMMKHLGNMHDILKAMITLPNSSLSLV